jgi:hypothetical protein
MSDRYTVGSVTGWVIGPTAGAGGRHTPATKWYVHDSAYGYRPVAVFERINSERRARQYAADLNAGRVVAPPKRRRPEARLPLEPDPRWDTVTDAPERCAKGLHAVNWLNTRISEAGRYVCRVCARERRARKQAA